MNPNSNRSTTIAAATLLLALTAGACSRPAELASAAPGAPITETDTAIDSGTGSEPSPTESTEAAEAAEATTPVTTGTDEPVPTTPDTTPGTTPDTTPETVPPTTKPEAPELDPAIREVLRGLGTWNTPTHISEDGRALYAEQWDTGATRTTCNAAPPETVSRVFDELAAFPFDGPLHPGLIVEGAGVINGELRVLPIERAPITLVSSLDSANPIVMVDEPSSVTLQQAVTTLKRDADAQFTGVDVTPADITYVRDEVHSFEQAYLGMGVSLRYASPAVRAQFDASFEQESQTEKHSIVARLVQPMFTIRAATDTVIDPGDYFAPTTPAQNIRDLGTAGRLGPDNVPALVESVTYGRVMYFTMTSSTVENASQLELAVEAAWGGVSGQADLTDRQRNILSESRLEVIAYGGDQDVAFNALRSGQLGEFFSRVNTTTAVPLSMTMRTLTGERVDVADESTFRSIVCTTTEVAKTYQVSISGLNGFAEVFVNNQSLGTIEDRSSGTISIPADRLRPGNNTVRVDYGDWFPCLDGSITASVLVDGRANGERTHAAPACWFSWEWNLDTDTAQVSNR